VLDGLKTHNFLENTLKQTIRRSSELIDFRIAAPTMGKLDPGAKYTVKRFRTASKSTYG
jgi:hypothetical protein